MSQWHDVVVVDPNTGKKTIENRETGLSPGQTGGFVGGQWVERPDESDPSTVYDPKKDVVVGKQQMGYQSRTKIAGASERGSQVGERRVYISSPEQRSSFEREQLNMNMPRQSGAATPSRQPYYPHFSPYASGKTEQKKYPNTPIESNTPRGYGLTSRPFYEGTEYISKSAQRGVEDYFDPYPLPKPLRRAIYGFGSAITGIPEFIGSGVAGWEYAARNPLEFKEKVIPSIEKFAVDFGVQAVQDPFYTGGQFVGMYGLSKTGKIKTSQLLKDESAIASPSFGNFPKQKPFPRQMAPLIQLRKPQLEIYYDEPVIKSRMMEQTRANLRDYIITRKSLSSYALKTRYGVGSFVNQKVSQGTATGLKANTMNFNFKGLSFRNPLRNITRSDVGLIPGIREDYSTSTALKQSTQLLQRYATVQKSALLTETKMRDVMPNIKLPKVPKFSLGSSTDFGMSKSELKRMSSSWGIQNPFMSLSDITGTPKKRKKGKKK